MKIKSDAFSGAVMKQFNGSIISPAMVDANTQVKGATGDTKLYYFVDDKGAAQQTKGLFLSDSQVEA